MTKKHKQPIKVKKSTIGGGLVDQILSVSDVTNQRTFRDLSTVVSQLNPSDPANQYVIWLAGTKGTN